jgi:dihydrofolate reductase
MIRHIVALDAHRGIAKNGAMPSWHLTGDEAYFTRQTQLYGGQVLMGSGTFREALRNRPLKGRTNYVVTRDPSAIPGAILVNDLQKFMADWPRSRDLWIIGGSEIFAQTMHWADELYVTEIEADFDCDRFYPPYAETFELIRKSPPQQENGLTYRYCVYRPLKPPRQ